jgi:hypothetical protein
MVCDECMRLEKLKSHCFRNWREQRQINLRVRNRSKQAKQVEQSFEHAYGVACAQTRLHKAQCHPEQGDRVDPHDLDIVVGKARLWP